MSGSEVMMVLGLLAQKEENAAGLRIPHEDLTRLVRKLDAVLEHRGLKVAEEEALSDAERAWLLGDTVDAVMLHAKAKGIDPASALEELKKSQGEVPVLTVLERRVDALLKEDRIEWDE